MEPDQIPQDTQNLPRHGWVTFLAILLVAIAQLLLYAFRTDNPEIVPLALWMGASGIGLYLWDRIRRPSQLEIRIFSKVKISEPAAWIMAAVLLSLFATVTMLLFLYVGRTNFLPVLTLWLGSAACYLAAFHTPFPSLQNTREWIRNNWRECLAVGFVTVLAAVLRFYKLGEIPRVINGDEGWLGNIAQSTVNLPYSNPFALWENFGALYLQAVNWAIEFLGPTPFSLRLIPAIAGTLAVPALYLLGRQIAGRRLGFLSAFLLAISHTHMNFSRTAGVGYIQDTWMVPLVLYLLLSGLEKRSTLRTALGGIVLGIQFSVYLTPQIFAVMILVFCLLVVLLYRRQFPRAGRTFLPFWGGLAIMILPEAVYAANHIDQFFTRLNLDGTFQSGWLAAQMVQTGESAAQILAGRGLHAFLSLIYYPAIDFYGSRIPMLSLFIATFFLIGLGYSLWKTRTIGFLLLNGYFWAGTLAVGIFAIPEAADSYRMLMVFPAAILMSAIGLDEILESFGLGWPRRRLAYAAVITFLFVNLFVFNQWVYYIDFAGQCRYGGDPQTRFASYLGNYLRTLRLETTVYLLSDDVFQHGTHASTDFLSARKAVTNVPDPADSLSVVSGDIIIASPNRTEELSAWVRGHPGGKLDYVYDCDKMILLAYSTP